MLGSIERLKRKWFWLAEKFGVFQQNRHNPVIETAKEAEAIGMSGGWNSTGMTDVKRGNIGFDCGN